MSNGYEFSYQSPKQKITLLSLKVVVALFIALNLYSLAWQTPEIELGDRLSSIGSVLLFFWIYSNLCRVKVEVQELFVPPHDNMHMVESMLIGGVFLIADMVLTVHNIFHLNGWL